MSVLVRYNEEESEIRMPGTVHAPAVIQDGGIMMENPEGIQL